MAYKFLPGLFLLLLLGASCTHPQQHVAEPVVTEPDTAVSYKNILYGTDTLQQNMDVFLPANRSMTNTPVVILIHGGSWVTGDKNDFVSLGLDSFFNQRGCAVVQINYRLYSSYSHVAPLEMEDMGLVMAYLKAKSHDWHINADRVCLMGKSSGSQIALLYAYSLNTEGRIKAVIDGFGPTNFVDSSIVYDPNLGGNVAALLGGPYVTNKQLWHDASPIFYMSGAVPTVIIQGTLDQVVYPIQSLMLQDSLVNRSIPSIYFSWDGNGHGWDQEKWLQCSDAAWEFVHRYL